MAEEPKMLNILVTWRGKELNVEIASHSTLKELGDMLHKLTNVKPDTMRLLVPQSTNKGSKLLFPFSDDNSSLSMLELETSKGKSIRMMGVFENEIEEVSQNSAKPNLRIIGFDEEEIRLRQLSQNRPQRSIKLPQGTYIFCDFRTLQIPGIELNPPASEALRRMHMLASDPGIIAIMNKHRWRVQIMTEMAPIGYVGISPKCILGFNKNHGEEISLRLRTDDLKGFRKYESIMKTLLHELAHMVYSEHDANFFALDRQLNQEAASLDWTKSKSNTLGGFSRSVHYEEESEFGNVNYGQKLGGESPGLATNPRQLSAAAAYSRLLNASSNSPTVSDPDVMEVDPLEIERIPGGSSSHKEIDEPDPDDVLDTESMLEAVKDDSMSHVVPVICEEPDPDDFELKTFTRTLAEPGPDDSQAVQSMTVETQFVKCHVLEKPHKEPDSNDCKALAEPDPDDDMGGAGAGNFDSDGTESARKLSNLTSPVLEVPGTLIDAPALDDKIVTSSFIGGEVISSVEMDNSRQKSMSSGVSLPEIRELKILEDSVSIICTRLQKAIEKLRSEATPTEAGSVLQTLFKIIRNLIEHPDDMKFRRLRKANPAFQRNVANYKAAMEILSVVGFYEDVSFNEIGKAEAFMVLKRNDPGLLWIAKSSLETCIG